MDADMAMHLSRARSNTVGVSPSAITSPPIQRPSGDREESAFTALSRQEEQDLSLARGVAHVHGDLEEAPDSFHHPGPGPEAQLNHLSAGHEPSLLVSIVGPEHEHDDTGGLPMYQASALPEQQLYDFSLLESYAREEKTRLGIQSPTSASPPDGPLSSSQTTTSTVPPLDSANGAGDFTMPMPAPRARQRKLSQSAPGPRRAKMALFEHSAGGPPPALNYRPSLSGGGQVLSAVPSYDNLPSTNAPDFSRQNAGGSGHDRPYRFSFYSNALSATIHARSLSELPAEGQTFEDLFTGLNSSETHREGVNISRPGTGLNGFNGNGPAQRLGGMMSPNPPLHPTGLSKMASNKPRSRSNTVNGPGSSNVDGNTWWLDVQSPTDEEMKLLSKVCENQTFCEFGLTVLEGVQHSPSDN